MRLFLRAANSLTEAVTLYSNPTTNQLFTRATSATLIGFNQQHRNINAYTDGSCRNQGKNNPKAGWGIHWENGKIPDSCGRVSGCQDCQRAELCACKKAMETAEEYKKRKITIFVDSIFAAHAVKNSADFQKRKYENFRDLMKSINTLKTRRVKGHSGNPGNEKAHKLAQKGSEMELASEDVRIDSTKTSVDVQKSCNEKQEKLPESEGNVKLSETKERSKTLSSTDSDAKNLNKSTDATSEVMTSSNENQKNLPETGDDVKRSKAKKRSRSLSSTVSDAKNVKNSSDATSTFSGNDVKCTSNSGDKKKSSFRLDSNATDTKNSISDVKKSL